MFIILFVLSSVFCQAQENLQPLNSLSVFQEKLENTAQEVNSIEADFTQEKFLDVFNEKIVSKGKFYFQKEDKIRLEYTSPVSYLMVINDSRLQITSEGKTNTISLGSNPMMKEMKGILAACMTGNLTSISGNYDTEYLETASTYVIRIQPKSKSVRGYITEMAITLNKKDMSVQLLRLSEPGNNYTEYIFVNQQYNTLIDNEKFTIR